MNIAPGTCVPIFLPYVVTPEQDPVPALTVSFDRGATWHTTVPAADGATILVAHPDFAGEVDPAPVVLGLTPTVPHTILGRITTDDAPAVTDYARDSIWVS